jgi:hypothetical protein
MQGKPVVKALNTCQRGFSAYQYAEAGDYQSIMMKLRMVAKFKQQSRDGRYTPLDHYP